MRWSKSLQEQLETFRYLLLADFVEAILEALAEHGQNGAVETSARFWLAGIVRMTPSSSVAPMPGVWRSGSSRSGPLRFFMFLFPGVQRAQ
jgi:hypothetical protein